MKRKLESLKNEVFSEKVLLSEILGKGLVNTCGDSSKEIKIGQNTYYAVDYKIMGNTYWK